MGEIVSRTNSYKQKTKLGVQPPPSAYRVNPVTYASLRCSQLRGGGGGRLLGPDPENNVSINGLIWNLVLIMVRMVLVNMRIFKLLAFLLLEIWKIYKISFPEWNESSRFDIYPLESNKIREKLLFMPENVFPGTNLYSLLHTMVLKRNKNFHMFNVLRRLISKKQLQQPPWWIDFAKLKLCQNVSNR